jgi:hypothetical protein
VNSPVRIDRIRASQERRHLRELMAVSSLAVNELDPYVCTGPLRRHEVTRDNPLRTGRCLCCRQFVGETRKGWRVVSRTQARLFNLYGAKW